MRSVPRRCEPHSQRWVFYVYRRHMATHFRPCLACIYGPQERRACGRADVASLNAVSYLGSRRYSRPGFLKLFITATGSILRVCPDDGMHEVIAAFVVLPGSQRGKNKPCRPSLGEVVTFAQLL